MTELTNGSSTTKAAKAPSSSTSSRTEPPSSSSCCPSRPTQGGAVVSSPHSEACAESASTRSRPYGYGEKSSMEWQAHPRGAGHGGTAHDGVPQVEERIGDALVVVFVDDS